MRREYLLISTALIIAIAVVASTVSADTETYSMDSLIGDFTESSPTKTDSLTYHGPGGKVTSTYLRIVGRAYSSQFLCFGHTFYYGADLATYFLHTPSTTVWSGKWENLFGVEDTVTYYAGDVTEDIHLSEGDVIEIGVTLEQYSSTCAMLTASSMSIQLAELIIEIDTVSPVEDSTWGRIKALYSDQ